jgi:hypothetical protein
MNKQINDTMVMPDQTTSEGSIGDTFLIQYIVSVNRMMVCYSSNLSPSHSTRRLCWLQTITLNYLVFQSFDFERTWWRLFWAYLMKVILSVSDEGYSARIWWRLFWAYPMKVIPETLRVQSNKTKGPKQDSQKIKLATMI